MSVMWLRSGSEKRFGPALWDGEGTLFLERRPAIWRPPSPRSGCARATRTEAPMFLSEDAFDLDGDGAGCVPPPPLSPSSAPRPWSIAGVVSPSTRHPGGGRCHLVPLTCAGARAAPADGRAASPCRRRVTGTAASGYRRSAGGVATPRPSCGGASRPRAARYSNRSRSSKRARMTRLKTDAFVSFRRPNRLRRPHARRGGRAPRARPARGPARHPAARARAARAAARARAAGPSRSRGRARRTRRLQPRREGFSRGARRCERVVPLRSQREARDRLRRQPARGALRVRGERRRFRLGRSRGGTRRARSVGAAEGAEGAGTRGAAAQGRQIGGCGTEHGIRTGIWGFGCFQGKRRGLCEANGSRAALAPDGARGLPATPAARAAAANERTRGG